MEVDSERGFVGFAKYSKLVEDNAKKDNETTMDKVKAEKLVVSWFKNNNLSSNKDSGGIIGFKTIIVLSCIFLMIVVGLVAGLIIMNMEIQELENGWETDKLTVSKLQLQNQNLTKVLESQLKIAKDLNIQNQDLLMELENLQQNHSNAKDELEKLNLE